MSPSKPHCSVSRRTAATFLSDVPDGSLSKSGCTDDFVFLRLTTETLACVQVSHGAITEKTVRSLPRLLVAKCLTNNMSPRYEATKKSVMASVLKSLTN